MNFFLTVIFLWDFIERSVIVSGKKHIACFYRSTEDTWVFYSFTLEEIILELFVKKWQSLRDNWVQNSLLQMRKLRPRARQKLAQGCTLLRHVLLKFPVCSQSSEWLNAVLLISLFFRKPCVEYLGEIRKEFLFPHIPPGLFKGRGGHVCKYFVNMFAFHNQVQFRQMMIYGTGNKLKSGKSWFSFSSVCFSYSILHYNASHFLWMVLALPVGKQHSSCNQRILKAYFLQLA